MGNDKLLAKFGERCYMERLIANGEIYMAPIAAFRNMEQTGGIGDRYENFTSYYNPQNPTITFKFPSGEEFRLGKQSRITYGQGSDEPGLIYCLTAMDVGAAGTPEALADIRKIGVGYDTMILFLDTPEFLRRVDQKLRELKYEMYYGFVEYYPEIDAMHEELTPFHKRERFSYQQEYRIYVECNNQNPLIISIGSLEDIAVLVRVPSEEQ